jgi:chromosome segregation ATPase
VTIFLNGVRQFAQSAGDFVVENPREVTTYGLLSFIIGTLGFKLNSAGLKLNSANKELRDTKFILLRKKEPLNQEESKILASKKTTEIANTIITDTEEKDKKIEEIEKILSNSGVSKLKNPETDMDVVAKVEIVVQELKENTSQIVALQENLKNTQDELKSTQTSLKSTQDELKSTQTSLKNTEAKLDGTQTTLDTVKEQLGEFKKEIEELKKIKTASEILQRNPEIGLVIQHNNERIPKLESDNERLKTENKGLRAELQLYQFEKVE